MSKLSEELRERARIEAHRTGYDVDRLCEHQAAEALDAMEAAARAAVAYDDAIRACANSPEKMASFCSAQGEDLDALYEKWQTLSISALAKLGAP